MELLTHIPPVRQFITLNCEDLEDDCKLDDLWSEVDRDEDMDCVEHELSLIFDVLPPTP